LLDKLVWSILSNFRSVFNLQVGHQWPRLILSKLASNVRLQVSQTNQFVLWW
jgi:hypothetical protein